MTTNKFINSKAYMENDRVVSDVAFQCNVWGRRGYIKPLFIRDTIPTIIRRWTYEGNVVRLI